MNDDKQMDAEEIAEVIRMSEIVSRDDSVHSAQILRASIKKLLRVVRHTEFVAYDRAAARAEALRQEKGAGLDAAYFASEIRALARVEQ